MSQSQVELAFSGALDAGDASDASRYSVRVDGVEVPIKGASSLGGTVTLSLSASTWSKALEVAVSWRALCDSQGRGVADGDVTATLSE